MTGKECLQDRAVSPSESPLRCDVRCVLRAECEDTQQGCWCFECGSRGGERGSPRGPPKWNFPALGAALCGRAVEGSVVRRVVPEVDSPAGCAGTYEEGLANACLSRWLAHASRV